MKLKKAEDTEEADLLTVISPQDEISPYATLLIFNIDPHPLQKIALHFDLVAETVSNFQMMTTQNPKAGEHKLQTVDLLGAAICIHRYFPHAQMSLNVRHDFMMEHRNRERELASEGDMLPEGYLQISPSCQLFLSQAGFDFSNQAEAAERLRATEVTALVQVFQKAHAPKHAWGA